MSIKKRVFFVFLCILGCRLRIWNRFLAIGIGKLIFLPIYSYLFSICLLIFEKKFFLLLINIKSQIRQEIQYILYTY